MPTFDDYREALKKLAPRGEAWPTDSESLWVKLLDALAQEFGRVDNRLDDLVLAALPDTTIELLGEWERVAGLPDKCSTFTGTIQDRRRDLLAKLTARGGQSAQYFIDLAASLGYLITITEFYAFRVDSGRMGDALNDVEWEFVWQVNSDIAVTQVPFRVSASAMGESLLSFTGHERLECVIRRASPAHTVVLFSYPP